MKVLKAAIKSRKAQGPTNPSSRKPTHFNLKFSAHGLVSEKGPAVAMIPQTSNPSLPYSPTGGQPRSLPSGAHFNHLQRPTLASILADEAPEPWTLAAFTEYCQQNLCIENLNFIMEAKQYRDHYDEWLSRCTVPPSVDDVARSERLVDMWQSILNQYIVPLGPQEVNISGEVRDGITSIAETDVPADPDALLPAVRKIEELMQDSILLSFINDVRSEHHADDYRGHQHLPHHHASAAEAWQRSRSIQFSGSPTASSGFTYAPSNSSLYHKHSTASTTSSHHHPSTSSYRSSRPKSVLSSKEPLESSVGPSTPSGDEMEDVVSSPRALSDGRASPHLSPMRSGGSHDRKHSPKSRTESGWKKLGAIMGLKRGRDDTP